MCIFQPHNKPIYKIAMNVLLVSLISEFNDFVHSSMSVHFVVTL